MRFAVLVFGLVFAGTGCTREPAPVLDETVQQTPARTTNQPAKTAQVLPTPPPTNNDVWFDDPLNIIADDQSVTMKSTGETPVVAPPRTVPTPKVEPPNARAPAEWNALISAEILDAEVKSIRNFLNQRLQSVGAFNSSMFEFPPRTATLAALAGVATMHTGELRWKVSAAYIRDQAATMHAETLQRGPKFQRALLNAFENINDAFSGSPPGDVAAPHVDFSEVVEFGLLMKRMDIALNALKTDGGNESGFRSESGKVRHEAAVMGTLMKVASAEDLGYGDDTEFLEYANSILEATQAINSAVEADDFEAFDMALSNISNACAQCHTVFKD